MRGRPCVCERRALARGRRLDVMEELLPLRPKGRTILTRRLTGMFVFFMSQRFVFQKHVDEPDES